jgi:hypothetical protein
MKQNLWGMRKLGVNTLVKPQGGKMEFKNKILFEENIQGHKEDQITALLLF